MISILCSGSRGDFQPYIALAQQIKKQGYPVRIVGMVGFKNFVEEHDIDFYPIEADYDSLGVDPKMLAAAGTSDNPIKMILTFNKMKNYGKSMAADLYRACESSDLIVYHPGMTIGYFAAKELGIPAVLASPFPLHKTMDHLSVVTYGKQKPTKLNKIISYKLIQGMLWTAGKPQVKSYWKKTFGRLPKAFGAPYEKHDTAIYPSITSCSNHVFKRPDDWNDHNHQDGYWFVETPDSFMPSEALQTFLNDGEKPIYIGFGSVFDISRKDEFVALIKETANKTGKRLLVSGMGHIDDLPSNVMSIGPTPHTWLFKHVAAVCHHGGAGTTAAGFAAGVPSIIVPFSNDQFAWAHRAYDIGVGAKPIYGKKITAEKLISAINEISSPVIIQRAKKLGAQIATEQGAKKSADVIISCLNGAI